MNYALFILSSYLEPIMSFNVIFNLWVTHFSRCYIYCLCYDFSQSFEHWFIWPLLLGRKSATTRGLPFTLALRNVNPLAVTSCSCASINILDSYFFFCSKYLLPNGKHIWVLPAGPPALTALAPRPCFTASCFFNLSDLFALTWCRSQPTSNQQPAITPALPTNTSHCHKNKPKSQ